MIRTLSTLIITFLLSFSVSACAQNVPQEVSSEVEIHAEEVRSSDVNHDEQLAAFADAVQAARALQGIGEPAMWTISDDDTVIHIFGSVHLLKSDVNWETASFKSAFAAADTIMFETDTTNSESMRNVQKMMAELGRFTDGVTLSRTLTEEQKTIFVAAAENVGAPVKALEYVKPWLVTQQLITRQLMKNGYSPQSGVEAQITSQARRAGKNFVYLETPEAQLRALSAAPLDQQIDGMIFAATTIEDLPLYVDTLVEEWMDGDLEGVRLIGANPDLQSSQAGFDALYTHRNQNWAPQIEALLDQDGTILVVVGIGHLVGQDSVINLLQDRGLTVTLNPNP